MTSTVNTVRKAKEGKGNGRSHDNCVAVNQHLSLLFDKGMEDQWWIT